MNVVVVSPSGAFDRSGLGLVPQHMDVILLTWAEHTQLEIPCAGVRAPSGALARLCTRFVSRLDRNVFGRSLIRLTPLDEGARFWRAARHDRAAVSAIARADVVVASERDAVRAAWQFARRNTAAAVVYGYPAARAAIQKAGTN